MNAELFGWLAGPVHGPGDLTLPGDRWPLLKGGGEGLDSGCRSLCSLRGRPSLLCGSPGGGQSRTQLPWLYLGGLALSFDLCMLLTPKLKFWAHAWAQRMTLVQSPVLRLRAALKSKPVLEKSLLMGWGVGNASLFPLWWQTLPAPPHSKWEKDRTGGHYFHRDPSSRAPGGPSGPCHCLSWGASWGCCSRGGGATSLSAC